MNRHELEYRELDSGRYRRAGAGPRVERGGDAREAGWHAMLIRLLRRRPHRMRACASSATYYNSLGMWEMKVMRKKGISHRTKLRACNRQRIPLAVKRWYILYHIYKYNTHC